MMNAKIVMLSSLVLVITATIAAADVRRTIYQIQPGGEYTYKPSPEGPGIPRGVPDAFRLDFGIGGTFVYELDLAGPPTARLLHLDLTVTGNEAIQADPPFLTPVTADRVEDYLASQTFVEDFVGGLLHLESSIFEGLKLTDGLNGNLTLHGGFDSTPSDGVGMLFNFSAVALPGVIGDTNADGAVDMDDLNNVRNHFGGTELGDAFPFDGDVDLDDLNAVRNHFGEAAAVPEPSSRWLGLLGMSFLYAVYIATNRRRHALLSRIATKQTEVHGNRTHLPCGSRAAQRF